MTSTNPAQDFKYNGKEFEDALGYNMYEMDMRSYDPAIARWTSIDPVVHYEYSTYSAFDNNPIYWADPSGADSINNFGNTDMNSYQDEDEGEDDNNINSLSELKDFLNNANSKKSNSSKTETDPEDRVAEILRRRELLKIKYEFYSKIEGKEDLLREIKKEIIKLRNKLGPANDSRVKEYVMPSFWEIPLTVLSVRHVKHLWSWMFRYSDEAIDYSKYGFRVLNNIDDVKNVKGLYIFDDATRFMKPYVGMSNTSIASRLLAHISAGRIGSKVYFKPFTNTTRTFLEVAETKMINTLGGLKGTANLRLPVSIARNKKFKLGIQNYITN